MAGPSPRGFRGGFTLIEVLVVVGVIGVLAGLLVPAVQAAREAARRAQCTNNLRQLGIALHAYHDAAGCLPSGRMLCYDPRFAGPNPPCTAGIVDKSHLIMLLPYLEQRPLYDSINQSLTIFGPENRTINTVSVNTFACPSDPSSGRPRAMDTNILVRRGLAPPGAALEMVFTSYSGCFGSFYVNALPNPATRCVVAPELIAQADGCLGDASPITLAAVSDGLSNTLFVAEKATEVFRQLDVVDPAIYRERGWYTSGNWGDTLITTFYPPNAYKSLAVGFVDAQVSSSSSLHPGGVNVLMGDGSGRFVRETVQSWPIDAITGNPTGIVQTPGGWWDHVPAQGIWQALSTRAGGEVLSSGSF